MHSIKTAGPGGYAVVEAWVARNRSPALDHFMPAAVYIPAAYIQLMLKTSKLVGFPLDRLISEIPEGEEVVDRKYLRSII